MYNIVHHKTNIDRRIKNNTKGIYMTLYSDRWDERKGALGNIMYNQNRKKNFMSVITKAERGFGKSMYNLMNVAYVYYRQGYTEREAWDKALKCFVFTPRQLQKVIKTAIANDEPKDFVILDDARVHFSNKLWFINVYTSALIDSLFDTIREGVNCILINCPSKKGLQSSLQNYDDYEITIYKHKDGGYKRKAVGINWFSLPDGKRKYRKVLEDHFSCYVPDWVYKKYRPIRQKYLADAVVELERMEKQLIKKKNLKDTNTLQNGVKE